MTDNTQELDEILWSAIMHEPAATEPGEEYTATWNEPVIAKAKQAIIGWHNKQIEAVLDRLLVEVRRAYDKEGDFLEMVVDTIKAERAKLKEMK